MKLPRRNFLHLTADAAALPAVSCFAWAQTYPSQRITMIVPFAPGAFVDIIARVVAEGMLEWGYSGTLRVASHNSSGSGRVR